MSKKKRQRTHARKRFRQRVGVELTDERRRCLIKAIQDGTAEFLERQSNRISHFRVGINDLAYRVVYDRARKEIVTVLFEPEKGETMQTVEQTLVALRPRQKADLEVAMEAFKGDIVEAEGRLDIVPEEKTEFELNSALAQRLQKANKSIDDIRLTANKPHQDSIKHNNGLVKPIVEKISQMVRTIRGNNDVYVREQQRIQREKEEAARRIEEGRRKAQETRAAKGMNVKPVEDIALAPRPVDFKKTTAVQIKKVWQWKITDYSKVPDEFKKPDWQRDSIDGRRVISVGKEHQEIPGIEVWSEDRSY